MQPRPASPPLECIAKQMAINLRIGWRCQTTTNGNEESAWTEQPTAPMKGQREIGLLDTDVTLQRPTRRHKTQRGAINRNRVDAGILIFPLLFLRLFLLGGPLFCWRNFAASVFHHRLCRAHDDDRDGRFKLNETAQQNSVVQSILRRIVDRRKKKRPLFFNCSHFSPRSAAERSPKIRKPTNVPTLTHSIDTYLFHFLYQKKKNRNRNVVKNCMHGRGRDEQNGNAQQQQRRRSRMAKRL